MGSALATAGAGFGLAGAAALAAPAITTIGVIGGLVGLAGGLIHVSKTVSAGAENFKQKKYI